MKRRHDRGFSLIEAMVASLVMLIGMLGLAGLQVLGVRANNLGKRMAQASLLAQDLAQNMQVIWRYGEARLVPKQDTTAYTDPNAAAIAKYWNLTSAQAPTAADGTGLTFDYSDGPSNAVVTNALAANYEGVASPVDPTLAAGEQIIFTRYWNVFNVNNGKLVQIVVRWKEPNFGYRSVTMSFFKFDETVFTL
jgi:prepilin-type N-terminal cleavage/methylation domain-containing protein